MKAADLMPLAFLIAVFLSCTPIEVSLDCDVRAPEVPPVAERSIPVDEAPDEAADETAAVADEAAAEPVDELIESVFEDWSGADAESPPEQVTWYEEAPRIATDVDLESVPVELSVPAEFENRSAVVLAGLELPEYWPDLFAQLVRVLRERVAVVVIVRDDENRERLRELLSEEGLPADAVVFVEVAHDTLWVRDFGPRVARDADGELVMVDARYGEASRPLDDQVPWRLGEVLEIPVIQAPIELDGGNLLSNGEGLCLTTTALVEAQRDGAGEHELRVTLRRYYGCRQVFFLEALSGEDTGHVDMFATFTSPDTVVIGRYDPAEDAVNSELLDRNALCLEGARTESGNVLRVERIPMPPNSDETWRSYTNVVFAGGRLLLPMYLQSDLDGWLEARRVYRRLLPGWEIVGVDSEDLATRGGALHCATLDLGGLARIGNRWLAFRMQEPDEGHPFLLDPEPPFEIMGQDEPEDEAIDDTGLPSERRL